MKVDTARRQARCKVPCSERESRIRDVGVSGHSNKVEGETLNVSAVLTRANGIAPDTYSLSDVDKDGWVEVLLGNEILPLTGLICLHPEVADLSGIRTPSTPPTPWEREEAADNE